MPPSEPVRRIIWADTKLAIRTAADRSSIIMWFAEPDGLVSYMNLPWYKLTGQLPPSTNESLLSVVHQDDRDGLANKLVAALTAIDTFSAQYRIRRADGQYAKASTLGYPYYSPKGDYLGYVGSVTVLQNPLMLDGGASLTEREKQVLQLIAGGFSNEEVSERLGISPRTVDVHVRSSMTKTKSTNRVQAVVTALKMGAIE